MLQGGTKVWNICLQLLRTIAVAQAARPAVPWLCGPRPLAFRRQQRHAQWGAFNTGHPGPIPAHAQCACRATGVLWQYGHLLFFLAIARDHSAQPPQDKGGCVLTLLQTDQAPVAKDHHKAQHTWTMTRRSGEIGPVAAAGHATEHTWMNICRGPGPCSPHRRC